MATDVEESDTEDHERPAPPKRQCMKIVNSHDESHNDMVHQATQDSPEPTKDYLRRWQACQVAKGFVDNAINRLMENSILGPHADPSRFRLFRGTEMEDTAVMMAIRNHGLVHSEQFDEHPMENETFSCTTDRSELTESKNFNSPTATTSSKIISSSTIDNFDESVKEKIDDGDEQDFLERAVAEAIKIKGLSALSVDYG